MNKYKLINHIKLRMGLEEISFISDWHVFPCIISHS
jgi:hypothetical protein